MHNYLANVVCPSVIINRIMYCLASSGKCLNIPLQVQTCSYSDSKFSSVKMYSKMFLGLWLASSDLSSVVVVAGVLVVAIVFVVCKIYFYLTHASKSATCSSNCACSCSVRLVPITHCCCSCACFCLHSVKKA